MTRRPSTLDQFLGIGGSDNQNDTMDQTAEPLELGQVISGQSGSAASVTAVVAGIATPDNDLTASNAVWLVKFNETQSDLGRTGV